MPLFLLFLTVPLIEIALFIQVGGWIGLWPTLLVVILTAVAGTYLLRSQGTRAMNDLRSSFNDFRDPSEPLAHGAMILFAGALLLTPGFFTDAFGLSLMIPTVRSRVFQMIRSRIKVQTFEGQPQQPHPRPSRDTVIDGEFEEIGDDPKPTHRPSGWTQH